MNRKAILMGSVSAVALASVATAAHAQDSGVPDGYTLSVEGGVLFGPNTVAEDKLGSGGPPVDGIIDVQDNLGYRAAIAMGKRIDPFWDLRVSAAINHQIGSNSNFSYSGGGGSGFYGVLKTDFDYETMDFEAGYRPQLTDTMDVRLFAGLRGLHYKDSADKVGTGYSGGMDKVGYSSEYTQEFLGVGPRIGIEASAPLGDSMFGVSGMLAGAAMFGVARSEASAMVIPPSGGPILSPVFVDDEQVTVFNLEAALGLDMHIDERTTVTLGYRGEGLFGITGPSGGSGGSGGETRWSHGPTLKLTGYFD